MTQIVEDSEQPRRISTKHKTSNHGVAIGSVFLCLCAVVRAALQPPCSTRATALQEGRFVTLHNRSNGCRRCSFPQHPLSTVLRHDYVDASLAIPGTG